MSNRTGQEIEDAVFGLLKNSSISGEITGDVMLHGIRPRESQVEDAVVRFVAGLPGQIETGIVVVNIFVPDIDAYGNGQFVPDKGRLTELEQYAAAWVEELKKKQTVSGFRFDLADTIHSTEFLEKKEHFVVIRLKYRALEK